MSQGTELDNCRSCATMAPAGAATSLTTALLTIRLAREAKRSVEWDSSTCGAAGVTLQMMAVLALPPSDGCRMRVSLLSRYGMCPPAVNAQLLTSQATHPWCFQALLYTRTAGNLL